MNGFIGIIAEDSPVLLIGLLSILKSGNSFVPISPTFPKERINYIISECGITAILTDEANYETAREIAEINRLVEHILCINDVTKAETNIEQERVNEPRDVGDTCYVIYTSGSTGRPKGVPITHRHLMPEFYWFRDYMELNRRNRVMQNLSYTFDFGVFEIFTTILYGGCLYVVDKKKIGDFGLYSRFINKHFIDTVHSTPVFFNSVVSPGEEMPSLKVVHLGGERLTGNVVKSICAVVSPGCKIHNGYGPTEATINCSIYTLAAVQCESINGSADIPIGRPTVLHMLYILDRNLRLLPERMAGELCIAGAGLAPGYLNNPELTAEKFQFNWSYGSYRTNIFYKTGDLARWLPDGNIEFLGRIDHQVKVRGYRIELGEIESLLSLNPAINEAVVTARRHENGSNYLCAYIVTHGKESLTVSQLREYLSKELPDYMIPAYFIHLERIPLTGTGKVDRRALPASDDTFIDTGVEYAAPVTDLEKRLVKIWQELLRIGRVGIKDDFFELGGDSILVNRCIASIRGELNVEIPMRKFFERPYINALAEEIEKQERQISPIKPVERIGEIPLSFAQERLWFLQELDADNVAYFVPRVIRMRGKLDASLIERTFTEIIRRHEILRTVFPTIDGQPVQRIQPPYVFKIPVLDWSSLEKEEQDQKVSEFLSEEDHRVFDFEKGPLLRVTILKLEKQEHLFVLTEHHLVHDGWTQGVLLREFIAIFSAYANGKEHDLPELPIQYADFAIWQRNLLKGDILARHLGYWQEKLSGLAPLLELPADRPRPPVISGKGALEIVRLSGPNTLRLKQFSRQNGATLFMTMLAVFKTLLYRYTGIEDFCVGTGIANRGYRETEGMLGMVINTLPLRTKINGEISFKECLNRVKETCLEAYQHEDTPFGKIVEKLQPERSLSYSLIFQVMFTFMDTPGGELRLPGLELELLPAHNRSAKFDINVVVVPPREQGEQESGETGEMLVEWEYNTDIFDPPTIQRMISHYNRLLEGGLNQPGTALSNLSLLSDGELKQILYEFNDTQRGYPHDKTIYQLFAEQAQKSPEGISLVGAGSQTCPITLTYSVLNKQADCLAGLLIEKGVLADNIAAIMMKRSIAMIIGIMGILKAGGAYLPIDPESPGERIDYMLKDSGAKLLIIANNQEGEKLGVRTWEGEKVLLEEISRSPQSPSSPLTGLPSYPLNQSNLVYIIYTSGSTGKPKGVPINHANLCPLLYWGYDAMGWRLGDHVIQTLAYYFDWSAWEILLTLTSGASLYMISEELLLSPGDQLDFIKRNDITVMETTPTRFHSLIATGPKPGALDTLRCLCIGAEKLTVSLVKQARELIADDCRVFNLYGPTEATIISGALEIDMANLEKYDCLSSVPIGKPVANSPLFVLDKNLNTCPINITGELYIAGDGVAIGYLNDPLKSNHSFIENRFNSQGINGERLYKTGDLVRWLTGGVVEFLGRIDYQVKIRGLRIELGEIENRLLTRLEISEAIVLPEEDNTGDKYLAAYLVSDRELPAEELRIYLQKNLPDYMIPSYFVRLEKIPLTANGKVDRKALPKPQLKTDERYTAPGDEIEKRLAAVWSEVLGQKSIGIDDNFFQLGGHSLKATILVSKIHKIFDVKIPLSEIFKSSTIRKLSDYIRGAVAETYTRIEPTEAKEYYPPSSAQKRLYFLQEMDEKNTAYNLPQFMKLTGRVELEKMKNVFEKLIQRHESFRTSFFMIDKEPVQRIHDEAVFEIEYFDLTAKDTKDMNITNHFIRAFDLSKAPLLRVGLLKIGAEEFLLMVDIHHIVSDGTSMGVLVKEFMNLYEGRELSKNRLHYKDYAAWENHRQDEITGQKFFWLNEFSEFGNEIPILDLPFDYVRPGVNSFSGRSLNFDLDSGHTRALNNLALQRGVTLYMVLLAVYNILLAKLSNQEVILIGTPTSGRNHADLEQVIGMFVNTLVLKNTPNYGENFCSFLEEVKVSTINAFENQDFQYGDLVEMVMHKRDSGRNPLFDTMFILQNLDIPTVKIPGLKLCSYPFESNIAKFDLTLICMEMNGRLSCKIEYGTNLFKPGTIDRFVNYFKKILAVVLLDPEQKIMNIDILPLEEIKQLLMDFNNSAAGIPYPDNKTIYQLFEDQVEQHPDHVALVFNDQVITFHHFDDYANRIAYYFRNEEGLNSGERVVILLERSSELIIFLMGVLKAGGAYVPLDVTLPPGRLRVILNDASIKIVVSLKKYLDMLSGLKSQCQMLQSIFYIDDLKAAHAVNRCPAVRPVTGDAGNAAYVMYTSGSSGTPKGVVVEHRTIVNTLWWRKDFYEYNEDSISLQNPPYYFDSSVTDIFTPLLGGARLVLVKEKERVDLPILKKIIINQKITHFIAVPAFYNVLLDEIGDELTGLKMICAAGEYFPDELVNKHFKKLPRVRITNEYGPTENSVNTTIYELTPDSPKAYIGKPIWNAAVYILNYMQLCPIGVGGEICLSGSSLARGYLNNPELTAEKFIAIRSDWSDLSDLSDRFYKTGDIGRWLADGNLEFLGRLDTQVKIRGIRIETGEIENQLMKYAGVKEAAVIARTGPGNEKFLCAYVVLFEGDFAKPDLMSDLKEYLSQKLPEYMIPSHFIKIAALPLMPSGKINREALPAHTLQEGFTSYSSPGNDTEEKMVEIWSEALAIEKEQIGIDVDFFELGGHSLRAAIVASRIYKVFNVKMPLPEIFAIPTIRGQAKFITNAAKEEYASIEPVEKRQYYALSPAQKRLYLLQEMEPGNVGYNMPQEIRLPGEINIERLQWIFKELIARHESLRTSFEMINEEPVQRIHDKVEFEIEYKNSSTDYAGYTDDKGDKIHHSSFMNTPNHFIQSFIRPFDLAEAPLIRAVIIKEENGNSKLWMDMHHIITDGKSQAILNTEFIKLYRGGDVALEPLRLQYKDYSEWQNSEPQQAIIKKQESYWLKELGDELPALNLPIDFTRPFIQSFEGNRVEFILTREENRSLKFLVRDANVTPFMAILAVFNILLTKLSGQEDIIIGTPVMGRRHADLEHIIGMFVNTLPLRNGLYGEMELLSFLNDLKTRTLAAYENQEYPFEELVEKAKVKRDTGRNPVFNVMFNLLNLEEYNGTLHVESDAHEYIHKKETSKFDLTLSAVDLGERVVLNFEYCSMLFKPATINRFIAYFKQLLYMLKGTSNPKLAELEIITQKEKREILFEFNNITPLYGITKTIQQLFTEQMEKMPDHIALVDVHRLHKLHEITYGEIAKKTDCLAHYLIAKGTKKNHPIGLMADHSSEMILGILGILKAGCAYVPLNPKAPILRAEYMLNECGANIMLTTCRLSKNNANMKKWKGEQMLLEDLVVKLHESCSMPYTNPLSLAYIIFTSGSTGQPKGVPISHANFSPLLHWGYQYLGISAKDRTLRNLAYYFDWSVWEIFITLTTGACLFIIPDEVLLNPEKCVPFMSKHKITILHVTPSQYRYFINAGCKLETLKYLFLGAEKLAVDLLKPILKTINADCRLFNMYGPTEATIVSAVYEINRNDNNEFKNLSGIPIGAPIANGMMLILDRHMKLCPLNVTGELYIAGDGAASGYLNNPELTAEKFDQDLWDEKDDRDKKKNEDYQKFFRGSRGAVFQKSPPCCHRFYKTGDLARWLPDGNIEFLGRIDQQVKIRGFRIELGDIEFHLKTFPGINEVVVVDRIYGDRQYLCAYFTVKVSEGVVPTLQQLKEHLEGKLPTYMIPACFKKIERIPLNPNGKIDRDLLPLPLESDFHSGDAYKAPETYIQQIIAETWREVLNREMVGVYENFFDLGGNSLDFVKVSVKLKEKLGWDIPVAVLFTYPTTNSLEHYLSGINLPITSAPIPGNFVMLNGSPKTQDNIFFVHEILGDVGAYIDFCQQLGTQYNCWGVEAEKLKNYVPQNISIEEIASKYISQMKIIQPHGPYLLATWSWGGHLGLEMALQLERIGETLSLLAFFDCLGPDYVVGKASQEFTLETEKTFLRNFFITTGNETDLEKINDIDHLWIRAVEILTSDAALVEQLRLLLIENALALPDYDELTGEELIQYLNLNRTHTYASTHYIPVGKIHTPIHYFAANQNTSRVESWKDYCINALTYHGITGDHHSIFRNKEHIVQFAHLFNEVLEKEVRFKISTIY